MREAQFFWKREKVRRMGVGPLYDIFEQFEFISYVKRIPKDVRGVFKVQFKPGKGPADCKELKFFEFLEVLSEPEKPDQAYLMLIRMNHAIVNLNARTNGTSAVSGKCFLNAEGLTYTVQGPGVKLRLISIMARMIAKPDRISARPVHYATMDEITVLSSKQVNLAKYAHERGFYETPKRIRVSDLAEELGLARATISEQLARIETTLMDDMFSSLNDVQKSPEIVRELMLTMEEDALDSGYASNDDFREMMVQIQKNIELESSTTQLHDTELSSDPLEQSINELE
tara:strand:- start:1375 stop:2232 length:858 start_codon:yes stop_codon:yes gene_type:complete